MSNESILVHANPNDLVVGSPNDRFSKTGNSIYHTNFSTGEKTKLNLPLTSFLGIYGTPLYKDISIGFISDNEVWTKVTGTGTKTGWVFISGRSPDVGAVVIPISSTPTPTPSVTPTLTPTPTVTPTVTPSA